MANVGGANQFGGYELQPGYGDVKKASQLAREAPLSGSPIAAEALNKPRRSQKQAARGKQEQPPPAPPPQPHPGAVSAQAWQQIAAIPGVSPLVRQYAMEAMSGQPG